MSDSIKNVNAAQCCPTSVCGGQIHRLLSPRLLHDRAARYGSLIIPKADHCAAVAKMALVIQSPFGGEITPKEIRARIGEADAVYIRVDQNKAYWVKGDENGSIDLW